MFVCLWVSYRAQVDPGLFRTLHNFMVQVTNNRGRVEVVSFAVVAEGTNAQEFAATSTASQPQYFTQTHTAQGADTAREDTHAGASTTGAAARPAHARRQGGSAAGAGEAGGEVVYPRGSIAGLPEEHASRRERFAELDTLQPGWQVELRKRGETVEAVFYAPGSNECVGAFAVARRQALAASKAAA